MNRRSFLEKVKAGIPLTQPEGGSSSLQTAADPENNPIANKRLPSTARSTAGLAPYTGPWTKTEASHLLKRCMFGPTQKEIDQAASDGLLQTLNKLFDNSDPLPPPPLKYVTNANDTVAIGESWVEADWAQGVNGYRNNSLRAWWIGLMLNQSIRLREKMTLFWFNHFVVEEAVVKDGRFLYRYLDMLRQNAMGNFKTLVEKVTIEPSMLRYLNGNQNTKNRPNENFGRELFELFTIGKGPIIGEGNYTNYTEEDIREASKVLTGWRDRGYRGENANYRAQFRPNQHDTSVKIFSAAFQNQEIANNGEDEYKDLINMIFAQKETARFICRKLYRWFIYYVIDEQTEINVIEPLAQILYDNNYHIVPALYTLLQSEHFFDSINRGCLIKNPIEFSIFATRQLEFDYPTEAENVEALYRFWLDIHAVGRVQQMDILSPPNVAGWSAYYQEPQFYEIWINSVSLPARTTYVQRVIRGFNRRGYRLEADPLKLVEQLSDPKDPYVMIQEWSELLFPQPLTKDQHDYLLDVLLPGLPAYEWELEYDTYLADPDNNAIRNAIVAKLKRLLTTMLSMAEFHLA